MRKEGLTILLMVVLLHGCGPVSYDECLLEKMKGQDSSMIGTVAQVCENKFPYEHELYGYKDKLDISWSSGPLGLVLKLRSDYGDYSVTKYKAKFSKKPCPEARSNSDYTFQEVFHFEKGSHEAVSLLPGAEEYQCMATLEIHGIKNNR